MNSGPYSELDREANGYIAGQSQRKHGISTPRAAHFYCLPYRVDGLSPESCIRYWQAREWGLKRNAACQTCKQGAEIRESYPELLI